MTYGVIIFLTFVAIIGVGYLVISRRRRGQNSATEPISMPARKESESGDEASLVHKVQTACQIAEMSAGHSDDEYERKRFEEYTEKGLSIARDINDDFHRSAAIHLVVSALIEDDRLDQAQKLIDEIGVEMIEERAKDELNAAQG